MGLWFHQGNPATKNQQQKKKARKNPQGQHSPGIKQLHCLHKIHLFSAFWILPSLKIGRELNCKRMRWVYCRGKVIKLNSIHSKMWGHRGPNVSVFMKMKKRLWLSTIPLAREHKANGMEPVPKSLLLKVENSNPAPAPPGPGHCLL